MGTDGMTRTEAAQFADLAVMVGELVGASKAQSAEIAQLRDEITGVRTDVGALNGVISKAQGGMAVGLSVQPRRGLHFRFAGNERRATVLAYFRYGEAYPTGCDQSRNHQTDRLAHAATFLRNLDKQ